jgi:hypothetical protein
MQSAAASTLMSVLMIAAFLLGAGGIWLVAKRRDLRKGVLMLLAALVMLGNVLVWTL